MVSRKILVLVVGLGLAGCGPKVATITVEPSELVLTKKGDTATLVAVPKDAKGNPVEGVTLRFSSSNPSVVTVDATTGTVTAVKTGRARITAAFETRTTGEAKVKVSLATSISFVPAAVRLVGVGDKRTVAATVLDDEGEPVIAADNASHSVFGVGGGPERPVSTDVTWESASPTVATVTAAPLVRTDSAQRGEVTAVGIGAGEVFASAAGLTAPLAVTVVAVPQVVSGGCPPGMAWLPGGSFKLGEQVTVKAYCLDVTEVTVGAWAECAKARKCPEVPATVAGPLPQDRSREIAEAERARTSKERCNGNREDRRDHPLNCVDWSQASGYCAAQGKRLPTEEEWEWAARGATSTAKYPWGNEEPEGQLCWSGLGEQPRRGTCPVGSYRNGSSPQGLQDLAGNVWEWTASPYSSSERVYRGGSWDNDQPAAVRAATRNGHDPTVRSPGLGFRCAKAR